MIDAPGAAPLLPPWRVERILYDEDGVLVVDKPPLVPTTGGDDANPHSVLRRLSSWLSTQEREGEPRALLRLDEEISGVLIVALTSQAGTAPSDPKAPGSSREAHPYKRTYLAVVDRDSKSPLKLEGALVLQREPVTQSGARKPNRRRSPNQRSSAKSSNIEYRVLRENGARALLELRSETDRAEEMRIALAQAGAPIVGDRLAWWRSGLSLDVSRSQTAGAWA